MRAVICRSYGTPEDLVIDDVAEPVPAPASYWCGYTLRRSTFPMCF
jgi:hypothetical protein